MLTPTLPVSIEPEISARQVPVPKFEYIDALRGWAILAVVLVHTMVNFPGGIESLPPLLSTVLWQGARGVQLFFIVSAFTLFNSMSRRKEGEKRPVLNFYIRRFFRIAPLYYVGFVVYSFWHHYALDHAPWLVSGKVAEVFFLHGLSPYWMDGVVPGGWSITCEMLFYLTVPLLFRYIRTLNHAVVFLLGSIVLSTVVVVGLREWVEAGQPTALELKKWHDFFFGFLPAQMPLFALGFILYFLHKTPAFAIKPGVILAAALIWLGGLATTRPVVEQGLATGYPQLNQHVLFGFGLALLAMALSQKPYQFFVNPITLWLGKYSYSLYLTHFLVQFALERWHLSNPVPSYPVLNYLVRLAIVLAVCIPACLVLARAVEDPGQRAGKWLIGWLERK